MADFINADEAKAILGCDDATLNNYVNNGTIRAQRADGQLMLHREDVVNLSGMSISDSDDGTIILSGDSEDLSIDLGEVVDDNSATLVQQSQSDDNTDSITFGDELEVVSFDDDVSSGTEELNFDDTDATQNLSFTDSNTAIATDVDETVVGTATGTATDDFQTVDYGDDEEDDAMVTGAGSVRRSVRSQRVRSEAVKTNPVWPVLLVVTLLVSCFFLSPYFFLAMKKQENVYYYTGEQKLGVTDHMVWTSIADSIAGFSSEPDEAAYRRSNPEGEWVAISDKNPLLRDTWYYKQFRGSYVDEPEKKIQTFEIDVIQFEDDPSSDNPLDRIPVRAEAQDESGSTLKTYQIIQGTDENGNNTYKIQD